MQAVILAAGKSTRTYPLTVNKPKPLLKIANKSILEHNLDQLQGIVKEAIIVIGFEGEMIKEALGEKHGKIRLKYVEQKQLEGNGKALVITRDLLENRFIAMVADDFYHHNDIKRATKHKYCILGQYVQDLTRFGEVVHDGMIVKAIREKPGPNEGLANTGLLVLDKEVFKHELHESSRGEYEITDFITFLIKQNHEVMYERVNEYWLPITYPWNILEANEFFLGRQKKDIKGKVESGATLHGNVVVGKGTVIKSGTYIEGPVLIGEDCIIGPNAYIRAGTSIGSYSKVGTAVDIKNSVIGDRVCVAHLAYVGDSIIGDNVNIAAGCITANLRHDKEPIKSPVKGDMVDSGLKKLGAIIGDNVKLGINTSIYPGRKIWPDLTTDPGQLVKKDLQQ